MANSKMLQNDMVGIMRKGFYDIGSLGHWFSRTLVPPRTLVP